MDTDTVTRLSNGLTVVLREVHSVPVISWWVTYKVGSRNERSGQTGASHWVEHMLFKGTDRFPAGVLDRLIDRAGGMWNAFTSMDYTMYYATLPAERIELAMEAEADRMVNARFDEDEIEAERSVILSERRGSENSPVFWLREAMRSAAFQVHGYRHPIIGETCDLEMMTREDIYQHYRQHYTPANATIVAVGAFDTAEMLARIEELYGGLPAGPAPKLFVRHEPEPLAAYRVTVTRPGHTSFLRLAQRVPAATHPDWIKLELLDSILTGTSGTQDNKTSRLYQALVKTGIAANAGGGLSETLDPYIYNIAVTINEGRTLEEAEAVLLGEIERVQRDGVTLAEMERARKQARAAFAFATESVTNQAYWISQSSVLGDLRWFTDYLERLDAVTLDDVQQVAQKYLNPETRVTGWLVPSGMEEDTDGGHDLWLEASLEESIHE